MLPEPLNNLAEPAIQPGDLHKSLDELAEEIKATGATIKTLERRLAEMTLAMAVKLKEIERESRQKNE